MGSSNSKRSIIDIGSNTIRLVIYQQNENGKYKETENIKTVARLQHYLNENMVLNEKGIKLLVKILKGFKEIVDFHHVGLVKCVATATIRQAVNKMEILKTVKIETGFDLTILSEKDEAYYGYFAVIHTTPIDEAVTVDIGGGSTEITYYKNRKLVHSHSFPFGVVSLKEQFIFGDQISLEEKAKLIGFIRQSFQTLPWLSKLKVPIIAIGGSARNVAQIDQNKKRYPLAGIHQYTMTDKDLKGILSLVEVSTVKQLEKLEGLSKDRADIIQPALTVFVQLSDFIQSNVFMFSRKGLRDGIFLKEYEGREESPSANAIVKRSIDELIQDYHIDPKHSEHIACLAEQIHTQIFPILDIQTKHDDCKIIDLSARVYYLGRYVDSDVSSQHTFYLLANKSIDGLSHQDRLKVALIASFKNKALLKQYTDPYLNYFDEEELQNIRIAGAMTKLAAALDASKRGIIKEITVEKVEATEKLMMTLYCVGNVFVEQYQAEKHIRQLEKAIKNEIELRFIIEGDFT